MSTELKTLMACFINIRLIRQERFGKMFAVKVDQTYQDAYKAMLYISRNGNISLKRPLIYFMRMDTNQAEIAATVLYVVRSICDSRTRILSEKDVLACVMEWKQRRKPALDQGEVGLTIHNLAALNWLDVKASDDLPLPEAIA